MTTAKDRLVHIVALACEGPKERAALAGELADIIFDWPPDCPEVMRAPVLALFGITVREAEEPLRKELAERLQGHSELPLDLVNEFFLSAPGAVRREILMRNDAANDDEPAGEDAAPDPRPLLAAARCEGDLSERAAAQFHIPADTAQAILADPSGEALAVLCKGAHLDRAAYSALAVLRVVGDDDRFARLKLYDDIPLHAAERLTRFWQSHGIHVDIVRAAE